MYRAKARATHGLGPDLSKPETGVVASDPLRVAVRALASEKAPSGYSGAVGKFTVTALVEPKAVAVGQSFSLTLTVRGTGNFAVFKTPELPDLPGFRIRGRIDNRAKGQRSIRYDLAAMSDQVRAVPAIAFPYFDVEHGRFETVRTSPVAISVAGRGGAAGAGVSGTPGLVPGVSDIYGIWSAGGAAGPSPSRETSIAALLLALVGPWVLVFGLRKVLRIRVQQQAPEVAAGTSGGSAISRGDRGGCRHWRCVCRLPRGPPRLRARSGHHAGAPEDSSGCRDVHGPGATHRVTFVEQCGASRYGGEAAAGEVGSEADIEAVLTELESSVLPQCVAPAELSVACDRRVPVPFADEVIPGCPLPCDRDAERRCPLWRHGLASELHAGLLHTTVRLAPVALHAREYAVLPRSSPASAARHHVVDRQLGCSRLHAAILTRVAIALEQVPACEVDVLRGHSSVLREHDDLGHRNPQAHRAHAGLVRGDREVGPGFESVDFVAIREDRLRRATREEPQRIGDRRRVDCDPGPVEDEGWLGKYAGSHDAFRVSVEMERLRGVTPRSRDGQDRIRTDNPKLGRRSQRRAYAYFATWPWSIERGK